ncbi:MAG: hypothetical protein V3U67_10140 [Gemmatimonadota bacterium]
MTTRHDIETAPELSELDLPDKHDGPGAAVIVAAGIGIFALGLLTVLSEVSETIHDFLGDMAFDQGVGPLAGKTILASLGFFISWGILGYLWRDKDPDIKRMFWIGLGLGIAGAIMTVPPVFTTFG